MLRKVKQYAPFIILALVICSLFFYGMPTFDILGSQGTKTQSKWIHDAFTANRDKELIVGRKGFILSYRPDAYSEQITIQGILEAKDPSIWQTLQAAISSSVILGISFPS